MKLVGSRRPGVRGRIERGLGKALGAFVVGATATRAAVGRFGSSHEKGRGGEGRHSAGGLGALAGHAHANLTTFRKNGEAVPTTVWFVLVDGRVYVTTPPRSGKTKRIRRQPRVLLTPSGVWGRPLGESVGGVARVVEDGRVPERAERAFREKYALGLALFRLFGQREIGTIRLEIRPAGGTSSQKVPGVWL